MLDLLLFHAWFLKDDPHEQEIMRPFPPLGPQYVASWLRQQGFHAVRFWDPTFTSGLDAWQQQLNAHRPKVVGLYGHTVTRPVAARMVAMARRTGARVIAGGPDPTSYLEEYLDAGVEVVVIGEGELTAEALMRHLSERGYVWDFNALRSVPGIAFRVDGEVIRTPPRAQVADLDSLPRPQREREDLEPYFAAWRARHGRTAMSMTTTRGCPYPCTWCSKVVYQDSFRRRRVEEVIDEMVELRTRFQPDDLWFVDDTFTIRRSWVMEFCRRVVERGAVTPFYIIGRVDAVDSEVLAALKSAGCYRIYYSAESGSQKVLDAMRKGFRVEQIREAGRLMAEAGLEMGVFVMLGYPGEDKEDLLQTVKLMREMQPEVVLLSVAHPIRGTAFYEMVKDRLVPLSPADLEKEGGRLRWESRYPRSFYELAGRMLWNEKEFARLWRQKEWSPRLLKSALRIPFHRARFALHPSVPGRDHPEGWDEPKRWNLMHRGRAPST